MAGFTKTTALIATCCALLVLGALGASAAAAADWTRRTVPPTPTEFGPPVEALLAGVSCPTRSLCVAVGGLNTVAVSQAPAGNASKWRVITPSYAEPNQGCLEKGESVAFCSAPRGSLTGVSCPTESLCVAVGYEGSVYVSSEPTLGAPSWAVGEIIGGKGATHLTDVSCPSPSLCVAVSGGTNNANGGKVITTTDPAVGSWQVADLGPSLDLRAVSCATPSLCVAVASGGRLFASADPAAGASAWRSLGTPGGPGDLEGVSCVAGPLCVAGNIAGNVLTSTDPLGSPASWSETNAGASVQITAVACPTTRNCLAVDNNGDVLTSTNPLGGSGSWHSQNLLPFGGTFGGNALFGAFCASTSLCALVGAEGQVFTSTNPFADPSPPPRPKARKQPRRPKTTLLLSEDFWYVTQTRRKRARTGFRFYTRTKIRGFECRRDRGPYRRCHSPLRYWAPRGHHRLSVRAIGPTGLRGPLASQRFCVFGAARGKGSLSSRRLARCGYPHQLLPSHRIQKDLSRRQPIRAA